MKKYLKSSKKWRFTLSRTGSPLKIAIVENVKDEKIYYSENLYCIRFDQKRLILIMLKHFLKVLKVRKFFRVLV